MKCAPGVILPLFLLLPGWAQDQPPVSGASPAPAAPPVTPVLENNGKPMVLPFHCTDQDIQWAGLTCSENNPCAVYLELASLAVQGAKIIVAGNIHTAAVTLYTALLVSEDSGHTWTVAPGPIRGAGLDHTQFLDGETAWVSGLMLFPLPQDPFLLLSTDGGKTWRQRPVSNESHPGAIQQFFFSSRTEGQLIVDRGPAEKTDRYERYESSDGGESWTILEENTKPLRLAQTDAPPADWRLRADSATQSYRLERRQGTRWTDVAAFAVKIGVCSPEQQEPEPVR